MGEERLAKLEEEMRALKLKLNHLTHPPHINRVLDYIREKNVVNMREVREKFSYLHGGSESRVYQTLRERPEEFVVVPGAGRKAGMIVAYLNDGEPRTFGSMAVVVFSETKPGQPIPLDRIITRFKINEEDAKAVYDSILQLFAPRVDYPKLPADKYLKPLKRRY